MTGALSNSKKQNLAAVHIHDNKNQNMWVCEKHIFRNTHNLTDVLEQNKKRLNGDQTP